MNVTISSRTPEGFPSRCPLCGAATNLEFSQPSGDAPCPNCGHLLWLSAELLSSFQRRFAELLGVSADRIAADAAFADLGADSVETVELVMELEEEFGISVPDDVAERFQTVGDAIRYIQEQRREQKG
jgi:acyl carrier protein